MRRLYYLINHEYRLLYPALLSVPAGLLIMTQMLVLRQTWRYSREDNPLWYRLDQIIDQSGVPVLFMFAVIILLLFCAASLRQQLLQPRSLFTYYQISPGAAAVFTAKALMVMSGLVLLVLTQLVAVIIAWRLFWVPAVPPGQVPASLLLGIVRSPFLSILYPGHFRLAIPLLLSLALLGTATPALVLDLHRSARIGRSQRWSWFLSALLLAGLLLTLTRIHSVLSESISLTAYIARLIPQAVLLAIICWRSIRALKNRTLDL